MNGEKEYLLAGTPQTSSLSTATMDNKDDTAGDSQSDHEHHHCLSASTDLDTLHQLSKVPALFRYGDDRPPEATGLALDVFGRGATIMASVFLGPALLELAQGTVEGQCQGDTACIEEGRVYGFRPSSLLSNIAIVSGLLGSIFMPVFGAIVDHTPYRWQVGAYSAMGLVVVKGMEAMVSSRTWFAVAILQVVSSILYNMHVTTTLAYTSELTTCPKLQTSYNTYYTMVLYIANLVFLAWVTITGALLHQGDVGTARIGQVSTSVITAVCFGWSWNHFFRPCPPLCKLPQGQTLWRIGFAKNLQTFHRIFTELPALKWLNFAVMFGEAATNCIITIATTYMKSFLQMNANEIAIVFLACLLMGGPGSALGGWVAHRTDPITSAIVCNALFIAGTTVAALTITGPEHKQYVPLLGMVWGCGMGWLFPMHSTAFINLTPRGSQQQAEFMGIYLLSGTLLSWMPPLLFTALNEAGLKMSYGLCSMDVFYVVAIGCLLKVKARRSGSHPEPEEDAEQEKFLELQDAAPSNHDDNIIQHRKSSTCRPLTNAG